MAIITWNKFDPKDRFHKPVGQSLTVPGQAVSLSELIKRYSRGEYVPPKAVYYGDDFGDGFTYDPGSSDLTAVQSMYEQDLSFLPENSVSDSTDSSVSQSETPTPAPSSDSPVAGS